MKRFVNNFRGFFVSAANHKREMRILSRVLTWRIAEARCTVRITYDGDPRHIDHLLLDCDLERQKSWGKTVALERTACVTKIRLQEPTCRRLGLISPEGGISM